MMELNMLVSLQRGATYEWITHFSWGGEMATEEAGGKFSVVGKKERNWGMDNL